MSNYKTPLIIAGLVVLVAIFGLALVASKAFIPSASDTTERTLDDLPHQSVLLDGNPLRVVVADTPELRTNGLSKVSGLAPDEGMLFTFNEPGLYGFWMKDMEFPLDIFWLDKKGEVVHIEKNLLPDTYPDRFSSESPAVYVLELPAGFADKYSIEKGSLLFWEASIDEL